VHVRVRERTGRGVLHLTSGLVLAALVGASGGCAGCAGTTPAPPETVVECTVLPSPPVVGPASVVCALSDRGGAPVTRAAVRVEANMSHPGMEPVFGDATETAPGRYAAPLELTMAGDWVVTVTATLADGRRVESSVDVRGVRDR
jgi:hypothetical protein